MELVRRIVKPLFWAALIFAYVMAVLPSNEAPHISPSDKVEHILAFLTLAVLGRLAYPGISAIALGLSLAGFGALIEFTQMVPALHRDATFGDWIADSAAIVAGLAIVLIVTRRRTPAP